jgi:hypothetical protein
MDILLAEVRNEKEGFYIPIGIFTSDVLAREAVEASRTSSGIVTKIKINSGYQDGIGKQPHIQYRNGHWQGKF